MQHYVWVGGLDEWSELLLRPPPTFPFIHSFIHSFIHACSHDNIRTRCRRTPAAGPCPSPW